MPSTLPRGRNMVSAPQRHALQQTQPAQQSPQVVTGETYQYLRRHGIPSKVEDIFSSVLNDRPEDPLQYIVDHLRRRSGCTGTQPWDGPGSSSCTLRTVSPPGANSGGGRGRGSSSRLLPETPPGTPHRPRTGPGGDRPPLVATEVLTPHEPRTPVVPVGRTVSPPVEHLLQSSLNSTSRTNVCIVRPSSATMVMPPWTSVRSSRNGTPYTGLSSFRLGGFAGDATYSSTGALSGDRDESTRSELSALSLASMDIQDFLQEFRSAKVDCVGMDAKLVTVEELSDILQQVNVPLPEIGLISDLFDEVKAVGKLRYPQPGENNFIDENASVAAAPAGGESHEHVHFDAFLSRMALAIQGRYPTELVRGIFYTIMESAAQRRCSAAVGAAAQRKQSKTSFKGGVDGALVSPLGSAPGRSFRHAIKSACSRGGSGGSGSGGSGGGGGGAASALGTTGVSAVPQAEPISSGYRAAPSESTDSVHLSTLLNGVPLATCVEEGLWQGLGIPASKPEVDNALRALGIPPDDDYEFHVSDFLRLVNALTGQCALAVGDRSSLCVPPSRENSLSPQGESYGDDS